MEMHPLKQMKMIESEEESFLSSGNPSILVLNNDCLFYVLSYLKISELMIAEEVCARFKEESRWRLRANMEIQQTFLQQRGRITYLESEVLNKMEKEEAEVAVQESREIANRVGPYVHTLIAISYPFPTNDRQIAELFKNLQKINLKYLKNNDEESIINFAETFKAVKDINITAIFPNFTDDKLLNMFNLNQAEIFNISGLTNGSINGKILLELTNSLDISFCNDWMDDNCIQSIVENLKNLEKLSISDTYNVSEKYLYSLIDLPKLKHFELNREPERWILGTSFYSLLLKMSYYNRLESLKVSRIGVHTVMKEALKNFSNLKKLYMIDVIDFKDSSLECLSNTLQYIYITDSSKMLFVTPDSLERLIERCTSLKYLDVPMLKTIDGDFIPQILKHLKERPHMLQLEVNEEQFPKEKFEKNYIGRNSTKLMLSYNHSWANTLENSSVRHSFQHKIRSFICKISNRSGSRRRRN